MALECAIRAESMHMERRWPKWFIRSVQFAIRTSALTPVRLARKYDMRLSHVADSTYTASANLFYFLIYG